MGAVMITLGGMALAKVMALVRIRKVLQSSYQEFLPWKSLGGALIAAMVSAIPGIIINAKLDFPPVVLLPISGVVYVITYVMAVLVLGLLTKDEIATIKSTLAVWNRRPLQSTRQASAGM
jgi:hypothetical protein